MGMVRPACKPLSIFHRGFRKSKCKTLLQILLKRIALVGNKRHVQVRQLSKDIAQLLQTKRERSVQSRVEDLMKEQKILAAYDMIQQFCEQLHDKLSCIKKEKTCPEDLQEAVASLIFAAAWCADLPELQQLRHMFAKKYGKEYIASIIDLHADCKVNKQIIQKLSLFTVASEEAKENVIKGIASEYGVEWEPRDVHEMAERIGTEAERSWQEAAMKGKEDRMDYSRLRPKQRGSIPALGAGTYPGNGKTEDVGGGNRNLDSNSLSPSDSSSSPYRRSLSWQHPSRDERDPNIQPLSPSFHPGIVHVHPKLPDYDDLTSKFNALKQLHKI